MTIAVHALCIVLPNDLSLPNTVNGSLDLPRGNYLAFPQRGSSPSAYDLHIADAQWTAGERVGAAFITVTHQGEAILS